MSKLQSVKIVGVFGEKKTYFWFQSFAFEMKNRFFSHPMMIK